LAVGIFSLIGVLSKRGYTGKRGSKVNSRLALAGF
jgi:hypothetical protein